MPAPSFPRASCGVVALAVACAPLPLSAQGSVSGQLTILEKPGEKTDDLGSAVIYLEPPAGAKITVHPTNPQVAMHEKTYVPHVIIVPAGSTVEFANQDPFRHNVFSNASAGAFDLGLAERRTSASQTFRRPGVYPVFCNIHQRMSAFVIAVTTPYAVQPGADGRFEIPNVPAGTYTMHAWHERGGQATRELVVTSQGATNIALQLDARGFIALGHKNKFGQDYASTDGERY